MSEANASQESQSTNNMAPPALPRPTWTVWADLPERERRRFIFTPGFWDSLSPEQQKEFLDNADWQDLRHVKEARKIKLDGLVSQKQICEDLQMTSVEVYWMQSTRGLPSWLVDGKHKYDKLQVDRWVAKLGGLEEVHRDVRAQIQRHRELSQGTGTKRPTPEKSS